MKFLIALVAVCVLSLALDHAPNAPPDHQQTRFTQTADRLPLLALSPADWPAPRSNWARVLAIEPSDFEDTFLLDEQAPPEAVLSTAGKSFGRDLRSTDCVLSSSMDDRRRCADPLRGSI